MQVMRRFAAIVFAAALLSLPSASSALATSSAPLPNLSSPSVATVSSVDTYVFARGTDNTLIVNRRVLNGGWTGSKSLGGGIVGSPSAVAVGDTAWAFVRGGDDNVYVNRVTNGQGVYDNVPGLKVSGRVTAINYRDGVSIFARGRDGAGYTNRFENGGWSGWQNLGGSITSDITPTVFGTDLYIFARGSDNAGMFNFLAPRISDRFLGWSSLGGGLTSNIAAYTLADRNPENFPNQDTIFLFARGFDNALFVNILRNDGGGSFTGWRGLGGGITSDPAATQSGDGRVTVMARGNDFGLYANTVDRFGRAAGYVGLGGGFLGSPDAIPLLDRRGNGLEVFARGFDNGLYTIRQVNGAWSGFVGLGGQLG